MSDRLPGSVDRVRSVRVARVDGRIAFEGNASELREIQRRDRYIEAFLS